MALLPTLAGTQLPPALFLCFKYSVSPFRQPFLQFAGERVHTTALMALELPLARLHCPMGFKLYGHQGYFHPFPRCHQSHHRAWHIVDLASIYWINGHMNSAVLLGLERCDSRIFTQVRTDILFTLATSLKNQTMETRGVWAQHTSWILAKPGILT